MKLSTNKPWKWEIIVIVIGFITLGVIVVLTFCYKPTKESQQKQLVANLHDFYYQVFQFYIAAQKGISYDKLKKHHKQIVAKTIKLRKIKLGKEEQKMLNVIFPYCEQIVEQVEIAVQRHKNNKQFDQALYKIGFTLEEIAKILSFHYGD